MKVNVKALRGALKAINLVVEKRNTVPILSHVLLQSGPAQLRLTGTDLELQLSKLIDLEEPGKNEALDIAVDAGTLASIAGKLPADGIAEILLKDGKISISCGRARFKLPTLPSTDMAMLVERDWSVQYEQDAGRLATMLHRVAFAMSTEDVRYYLKGVYLHVPEGSESLFAAATNGHRLARYHEELPEGADELAGIILPAKAVKTLSSLLDDEGGPVDIAMSGHTFRFDVGQTTLVGKAIEGSFPDYSRVIPSASQTAAWFDPGALVEAIERVLTISTEKTRGLALDFQADRVVLDVTSLEHGTASEEVPIELTGAPVRIGFNGRYLLDLLGQLRGMSGDGGRVVAKLNSDVDPTLWQTSDEAQAAYVLMPMRV